MLDAILHYALKRLGLDLNPAELRGQDQQIVLLNSSELRTKVSDITRGEL